MYVNMHCTHKRICNSIRIHKRICNPDLELLTLSGCALYLLRELMTVVLSCVYVPPNVKGAAEQVV